MVKTNVKERVKRVKTKVKNKVTKIKKGVCLFDDERFLISNLQSWKSVYKIFSHLFSWLNIFHDHRFASRIPVHHFRSVLHIHKLRFTYSKNFLCPRPIDDDNKLLFRYFPVHVTYKKSLAPPRETAVVLACFLKFREIPTNFQSILYFKS